MPLTDSEVREKLGLKPHAEHEYDTFLNDLPKMASVLPYKVAVAQRYRGTGRSTETAIAALLAVSNGFNAILVGRNFDQAKTLVNNVRRWADKLGLDPQKISGETITRHREARTMHPHSGWLYFTDHYAEGEE